MERSRIFFKTCVIACAVILFAALPKVIFAANIIMSASAGTVEQGKTVVVTVYASSPGVSINAVSGTVTYPADLLAYQSISTSGSIVNQWLPPGASGPKTSRGAIVFDGIMLAGYQGQKGKLFSVTFKMIGSGDAAISVPSSLILANDGSGTDITQTGRGVTITGTKPKEVPPPVVEPPVEIPVVTESTSTVPVVIPPVVETPAVVPEIVESVKGPSWWTRIAWVVSDSNVWILVLLGILCIGIFFIAMTLSRIERRLEYLEGLLPPPRKPRANRASKKSLEVMSE